MQIDVLKKMAASNEESLRFISKDMNNLARMLKKTPFLDEHGNGDKFQANLVQGSFYLTAYTVATKAFNNMVNEKGENPDCDRKLVDYFLDEIISMQATETKKEIADKAQEDL